MPKEKDKVTPIQAKIKKTVKRLESKGLIKSETEIEAWEQFHGTPGNPAVLYHTAMFLQYCWY